MELKLVVDRPSLSVVAVDVLVLCAQWQSYHTNYVVDGCVEAVESRTGGVEVN